MELGFRLMAGKVSIFWFRRDLRLNDNVGLYHALNSGRPVLPVFIFDTEILEQLGNPKDARVSFIHQRVQQLHAELRALGSGLLVIHASPKEAFNRIVSTYEVDSVFFNHDYEPAAIERDTQVGEVLAEKGISFQSFKDQVIFEKDEILSDSGKPYTVYTPYSKKWKSRLSPADLKQFDTLKLKQNFFQAEFPDIPSLAQIGFKVSAIEIPPSDFNPGLIRKYHLQRDIPSLDGTSRLGLHLRFGTVSVRELASLALKENETFLNELIWREFFMQVLWHFPRVVNQSFKVQYEKINWRNDEADFKKWCEGKTGYPIVDAGMRELVSTGHMHNRVRMIVASFLVKHLLIDWRWGESFFASHLLDFELASNNGNWQWAAGCGCDAAPYFRIFNPTTQQEKFDPKLKYVKRWVPEFGTAAYVQPMVEHKFARERCLAVFAAVQAHARA